MTDATPFDTNKRPPLSISLFKALAFPSRAFNEAFGDAMQTREHWKPLVTYLNAKGFEVLNNCQVRVRRMRYEDGATFNPFDDASGHGIPWDLDMMPVTLTAAEWAVLESGLIQRAHLLEHILADVYGPNDLIRKGCLPAELVYANPNFLRTCYDIQPAGKRYLTFYAVDLYRAADGRFRVLRDYGANPAGLGYALENRIVISRVFSELYHKTQIQRLAPFFQTFHRSLIQRAAIRRADPGIVLLSPGPDSRIYFEHALLSRYLGYPLVEGQDLTVRNGEVYLKKLAGLEPVEVIFRHIPDHRIDPFALRRETTAGVAGLVQAFRIKNVDIVNPIGSGFVETPILSSMLPRLCQEVTGADLQLENHPAWWCGIREQHEYVQSHMTQLNISSALDRTIPVCARSSRELASAMAATPYAFMASEPIMPSAVPAWTPDGVQTRFALLRVFVCATDEGYAVMPGGLAITALEPDKLISGTPDQQQSKDIWVLSEQPVQPFSLMGGLQTIAEFRRASDLPSRVADNLLWLGRYLERAEGLVRLLRSVYRRLSGEARLADIPELAYLLNLLRAENIIPAATDSGKHIPRFRELSIHLDAALYRPDQSQSVVATLKQVRMAARNVRDRLSLDSWRVINRLEGFAGTMASDPLELLDDTLFTLSAFSGLAMESMTRGLGWRFMDMGRRVERAIHQTNLIHPGLSQMGNDFRSALEALLEVADSIMTYRARYRTAFQLAPVLDLLLVDESNPKSLVFQCSRLADHVEHLPRPNERRFATEEERLALEMLTSVRLLDVTRLDLTEDGFQDASFFAFLDTIETRLKAFAQHISAHYLSRVASTPHFSFDYGDR